MSIGFLYVLQNKAFGANVIKIGLTTRTPHVRAREIYVGASGVPLPFDVAVAYSVANCALAEKRVHKCLRTYRLNSRREFFRLPSSVGASFVYQTCAEVNAELGAPVPERFDFSSSNSSPRIDPVLHEDMDSNKGYPVQNIALGRLAESPVGTSTLTDEQAQRAGVLYQVLAKLNSATRDKWLEDFTRDEHPERELQIWEHLAKAYLTLEHVDDAPEAYRAEAFELLLKRTWSKTAKVLADSKLTHFSSTAAKRLLDAYELRPKPFVIRREAEVRSNRR